MCFPDQNWPYLLLLKPKELGFAVIALGGVGGGTAPHPHPGTTPLQHLLILLQSQLSTYAPTAFVSPPWKDFLPVLAIINFTSLAVISPCNVKG